VTGGLLLASGVTVWIFVHEEFTPPSRQARGRSDGLWDGIKIVLATSSLVTLFLVRILSRFGSSMVSPVLSLFIQDLAGPTSRVAMLTGLINGVTAATSAVSAVLLGRASDRFGYRPILLVCMVGAALFWFPQALVIRERVPGADEAEQGSLLALARDAVDAAAEDACTMRVREGGFLDADLESRRLGLGRLIDELAVAADEGRATTEARLAKRVAELATEATVEPALIAQEIVRAAARSDISEEVVRFKGHLDHWLSLARGPEPCGRKLDFLLQEMNREVNTIGSKAEGRRVAEFVVQMKAELEKMREQVQNVE
jgi:hypothetical protein